MATPAIGTTPFPHTLRSSENAGDSNSTIATIISYAGSALKGMPTVLVKNLLKWVPVPCAIAFSVTCKDAHKDATLVFLIKSAKQAVAKAEKDCNQAEKMYRYVFSEGLIDLFGILNPQSSAVDLGLNTPEVNEKVRAQYEKEDASKHEWDLAKAKLLYSQAILAKQLALQKKRAPTASVTAIPNTTGSGITVLVNLPDLVQTIHTLKKERKKLQAQLTEIDVSDPHSADSKKIYDEIAKLDSEIESNKTVLVGISMDYERQLIEMEQG